MFKVSQSDGCNLRLKSLGVCTGLRRQSSPSPEIELLQYSNLFIDLINKATF